MKVVMTTKKTKMSVFLISMAFLAGAFAIDLLTPRGVADWPAYLMVPAIASWWLSRRETLALVGIDTSLFIVGYYLSPPGRDPAIALFNRVLAVAVIWSAVILLIRHRQAQRALRKQEALFRIIFDEAFQLMGLVQPDGTVLKINRPATDLISAAEADFIGHLFWETPWWAHSPDLQAKLKEAIKAAATGEFIRFEASHPVEDGLVWIDFSLKPVQDESGAVVLLVAEGRDITERKLAEERSARLAAIVECSDDAIIGKTSSGVITSWNPGAEKIYGYSAEEMIGRHISAIVPPERMDELEQLNEKVWRGERGEHIETTRIRKDGTTIDVSLTLSPVRDGTGSLTGSSAIARDITEHKSMIRQIQVLNETLTARAVELEATNRELEAFSSCVSHDLRKPLTIIDGYCQIMLESPDVVLDDQSRAFLREIYNGTKRMDELIDTLLKFSQATFSELRRSPVDLSEMAREIAAELRLTTPNRRVAFSIAEGIVANGDRALLRVVLENLISNAWKYTGKREEAVIEMGLAEGGDEVCFVRDNGSGFDMSDASKLFIPFQRLPGAETFEGNGIGLAMVQRIILRHGGKLWAEAERGRGATFFFTVEDRRQRPDR